MKKTFSRLSLELTLEWESHYLQMYYQSACNQSGSVASTTNEMHTFDFLEGLATAETEGHYFLLYGHDIGEICIMTCQRRRFSACGACSEYSFKILM